MAVSSALSPELDKAIVTGNHAEIAVAGFAGMDKKCGSTGAGHGGGDFAANVPGFSHAADHDTAFGGENQPNGRDELIIQSGA